MSAPIGDWDSVDVGQTPNLSTSVVMPRPWEWGKYVTSLSREGFLEKQSIKDKTRWKRRWVVMHDNVLYFFKEQIPPNSNLYENDNVVLQRYRHGSIQLDTVATVCTAKEWGPAAFQIKLQERKYIFRAATKDEMGDWLFEFQRSIANLIYVIRTKSLSTSASVTRHIEMAKRQHRSQSFDCRDHVMFDHLTMRAPFDEYSHQSEMFGTGVDPTRLSNESAASSSLIKSPTSPNYYPFQLEELGLEDMQLPPPSSSTTPPPPPPPQASSMDINPPTTFPELQKCTSPPTAPVRKAYIPPHLRKGFVSTAPPVEPPTGGARLEYLHLVGDSAMDGTHQYGLTSLVGKRSSLEDMICCHPDFGPSQAVYALFDGHAGVDAAKYAMNHLPAKLKAHPEFGSNWRAACTDVFRQIDEEFLKLPRATTGTTASVVVVRGRKLLTANIGDSRAVISINGQALDIISVQNPGRTDERARIEKAGGWVLEEKELHMNKLHGMDLNDPMIEQKANRVVRWIQIFRVNGELAVSRAIGDVDYKRPNDCTSWLYPEDHDRSAFTGSLVIPDPEFEEFEITPEIEFFVLACDGLWDTITSQEAVNHVREKLLLNWSMQDISYSLADLAIRSGSLDNVSVVVALLKDRSNIT
ncbi:unnamed protein product [Aphanomyces euteiches]